MTLIIVLLAMLGFVLLMTAWTGKTLGELMKDWRSGAR